MNDRLKDLLDSLNITEKGSIDNKNKYTVKLLNSDEFAKYYSSFENSTVLTLDEPRLLVSEHLVYVPYLSDLFKVTLVGNFDEDLYNIVIEER